MNAANLDPGVCREHLAEVLGEEAALLGELHGLLERESETLGSKDAVALEKLILSRQERVGALARLEEHRRALCSMHGYTPDFAGLERLMMWCDPQGSLMHQLRDCAKRAADCRDLNDRNGVMVSAKLKRVEGLLGALTGRPARSDTYGPGGATMATRPGRVLGAA
jgi:flagellar biosynthesis protein FlgN